MPIVLDLAIGTPVMCTKNWNRKLKLANGSLGRVVGVQFPPGTPAPTRVCIDEQSASFVNKAARIPDIVYVELLEQYTFQNCHQGLSQFVRFWIQRLRLSCLTEHSVFPFGRFPWCQHLRKRSTSAKV